MAHLGAMAAVLLGLIWPAGARADEVADFYRGRQISIIVGYGPGGAYDLYARLLTSHLGRHLPGSPTLTIQHMPGAGSLRAVNHLANVAPKDGTVIATFARHMALLSALGGASNVQFDARTLNWLGSSSNYDEDAYLLWVRADSHIKTLADLRREGGPPLVVGGTAQGASGNDVPLLLRDVLKLNIKLVAGYQDANAIYIAVDRKEVDARATDLSGVKSGWPSWLERANGMRTLVQFGRTTRHPEYRDVPTVRELATEPFAQAVIEIAEMPYRMSRPFAAPPGVPPARVAALRKAFMAAHGDAALQAEAAKLKLGITPVSGEEIDRLIDRLGRSPPAALEHIRKLQSGG